MNPRVSRSSALASKATGFPIAKIAARLAVGYALEEIDNDITKKTPASFEPTIDYVVVKWPRFAFEKFPGRTGSSTPRCSRSARRWRSGAPSSRRSSRRCARASWTCCRPSTATTTCWRASRAPRTTATRSLFEAIRRGHSEAELCERTGIDPWFMAEMAELARGENPEEGLERSFKSVDTCAAEFEAETPYYYSGWERRAAHEVRRGDRPSVVILGSGPNRIGQGIEFDYCCVHAAMTVRESGRDAVMINCNPETVSTDYDTSDRLYFEPLTLDDVLGVIELEQPEGVIVQFGGQTPLKLAAGLADGGRAAARDAGRLDPPRRGPAELRGAARRARAEVAAVRDGRVARRGARGRRRRRLSAAGAPLVRARRPGDGDLLLARAAPGLPQADERRRRAHDLPRPLPRERDRDRRGRALRRHRRRDRRDHAARRGGRRPLGRLGVRDPGDVARRRDDGPRGGRHPGDRARPRRGRADQHPVRDPRRQRGAVRDRGEPARLADGAVRVEGDRRVAGEAGVPPDARRAAGATWTSTSRGSRGTCR